MKKSVLILVCLFWVFRAFGFVNPPFSSYGTSSAYHSEAASLSVTTTPFRSTSTIVSPVGYTSSAQLNSNGTAVQPSFKMRSVGQRRGLDKDDDDDPIAQWPDGNGGTDPEIGFGSQPNLPVGDIPVIVMLLMSFGYSVYRYKKAKNAG